VARKKAQRRQNYLNLYLAPMAQVKQGFQGRDSARLMSYTPLSTSSSCLRRESLVKCKGLDVVGGAVVWLEVSNDGKKRRFA
jgi:hypothetical protein